MRPIMFSSDWQKLCFIKSGMEWFKWHWNLPNVIIDLTILEHCLSETFQGILWVYISLVHVLKWSLSPTVFLTKRCCFVREALWAYHTPLRVSKHLSAFNVPSAFHSPLFNDKVPHYLHVSVQNIWATIGLHCFLTPREGNIINSIGVIE